jgi:hypothetical protein
VEFSRTAWSARLIGSAPRISPHASLRLGQIGIHGRSSAMCTNFRSSWHFLATMSDKLIKDLKQAAIGLDKSASQCLADSDEVARV